MKRFVAEASDSIHCWYEAWDGMVSISFSGGIDSTVLAHLAHQLHPDIPLHHCDTGLEYPEIRRFVRTFTNLVIVRPKRTFKWVIENKGLPLVSKKVARQIRTLRNPSEKNVKIRNLYLTGVTSEGKPCERYKLAAKWKPLIFAPFNCSEQCCDIIKKEPLSRIGRETGRKPMIGIMSEESDSRKMGMKGTGCNLYDSKHPVSRPLKNWTKQHILQYVIDNNVQIASIYGDIVSDNIGVLNTTGEARTGCMFCGFGAHLEKPTNRFQRMAITHPKEYDFCMNKLGLKEAFLYIGVPIL